MEAKKIMLGIAGFGLVYMLVRKNQLYQGLQFSFAGVSFGGSISRPEINLKISLNNPTPVTANLQAIAGNIFSANGDYLAKLTYDQQQIIAPFDRTIIQLKLFPDLIGAAQSLAAYISNKKLALTFQGSALIDNIPVPVRMTYNYGSV